MTQKIKKTILATVLILVGAAAFLFIRSYVFTNVGSAIHKKLESLKVSGFNVNYDSISIDWRSNIITIENLVLEKNAYDTTCVYPEFIAVGKITADGFRLFPLIFKSRLSFERVHLENPHIVLRDHSQLMLDSALQRENEFTLSIDEVVLKSAKIEYTDTVNCELITGFESDFAVAGLKMDFHVDEPFVFKMNSFSMDSTRIRLPKEFYSFEIRHASADMLTGTVEVDSIRVLPDFSKIEFGRKRGYEVDRFEGLIPNITLASFSLDTKDSIVVRSASAEVQFYVKIFRDKRLPFKTQAKEMPIALLKKLPFTLQIDSLKIKKSYVQYEELISGVSDAGLIYFDNMTGFITNINNRSNDGNTLLVARASLMGHGDAYINATFPLTKNKRNWISGSVENFSIPKINSMLTPSTNIKVESGEMNKLSFAFSYNNIRADGEIELNYNNLKVVSFKEEGKTNDKDKNGKDGELQKDNLKTFIMNTFIFRKNMDEKVPEDKRTGTVMYLRDDSRSIFNFWVKSVLSGIKSAYNLDKPEAQKDKREAKKEEKLTKKEARKLKKAEKRRERG